MVKDKALAFIESELALARSMVEYYEGNPPEFDWKGSVEILSYIKRCLEREKISLEKGEEVVDALTGKIKEALGTIDRIGIIIPRKAISE